jgi:hypothetical protein
MRKLAFLGFLGVIGFIGAAISAGSFSGGGTARAELDIPQCGPGGCTCDADFTLTDNPSGLPQILPDHARMDLIPGEPLFELQLIDLTFNTALPPDLDGFLFSDGFVQGFGDDVMGEDQRFFGLNAHLVENSGLPPRLVGDFDIRINDAFGEPAQVYDFFCGFEPLPSITVLKLNGVNNTPLPGWEMKLYAGSGCTGSPIDTMTTDDDGLLDFTGLSPNIYSVAETPQDGWDPESDECQDVDLLGPAVGSLVTQAQIDDLPDCPTQPDLEFPGTGCDAFDSGAQVNIQLAGQDEPFTVTLNGPTQVERKNAPAGSPDSVDTEIVALELTGMSSFGEVSLRLSNDRASTGRFQELVNETPGEMDFPADSFFDVFAEVVIPGVGTLTNDDAVHVECEINAIPPLLCLYQPPIGDPIELLDEQENVAGYIVHALHLPLPLNEKLVVFTNVPANSITVLKLNGITQRPLRDWQMTLYEGAGCTGLPKASGVTDGSGIVDFTGLLPGTYSVQETLRTYWSSESGDACEDVEVTDASPAALAAPADLDALPDCPIANGEFPAAGCDEFDSGARIIIQMGEATIPVTLNGPTQVERKNSPADGDSNGRDDIDTEILALELEGTSSLGLVTVRQSSSRDSLGAIEEQANDTSNQVDFPADSFFDVFVEVSIPGVGTLHNVDPIRMQCVINEIPPILCFYEPPPGDPIELLDDQEQVVAFIVHAVHLPLPPNEVLVVFSNVAPQVPFPDVPQDHWAFGSVCAIFQAGITAGFPDGTYGLNGPVTRAQMAAFLIRAMGLDPVDPPTGTAFPDVPASHWAAGFIERLVLLGVTSGFPDGTYRPDDAVTRAQMAVFIIRALGLDPIDPPSGSEFTDVPASHWAAGYIERLVLLEITSGFPDGTYRPDDTVTRAQMAAFLTRAWELDVLCAV